MSYLAGEIVNRVVRDKFYFNGLDYVSYSATASDGEVVITSTFELTQQYLDNTPVTTEGLVSRLIESNDRFFVITNGRHDTRDGSVSWVNGKLYAIDNSNDSVVELATCTGTDSLFN